MWHSQGYVTVLIQYTTNYIFNCIFFAIFVTLDDIWILRTYLAVFWLFPGVYYCFIKESKRDEAVHCKKTSISFIKTVSKFMKIKLKKSNKISITKNWPFYNVISVQNTNVSKNSKNKHKYIEQISNGLLTY